MSEDMLGAAVRKLVALPAETQGVAIDLLGKLHDPAWLKATKRFVRKEDPWPERRLPPVTRKEFEVEVGRYPDLEAMIVALEQKGIPRPNWVGHTRRTSAYQLMFERERCAAERKKVRVLVVAGADLAGAAEHKTWNILRAAAERGWKMCPVEVGLAMCEQLDLGRYDRYVLGMDPIDISGWQHLLMFSRTHWSLTIGNGRRSESWDRDLWWVFFAD